MKIFLVVKTTPLDEDNYYDTIGIDQAYILRINAEVRLKYLEDRKEIEERLDQPSDYVRFASIIELDLN